MNNSVGMYRVVLPTHSHSAGRCRTRSLFNNESSLLIDLYIWNKAIDKEMDTATN